MSFVTNVTCARGIYKKFLSFFNTKGVFACQHDTRASDNSDSQCPIKISTDAPLRESLHLERGSASRVPVLKCDWENLTAAISFITQFLKECWVTRNTLTRTLHGAGNNVAHPLHLMCETIIINLVHSITLSGTLLPIYLRNQCETTNYSIWVPVTLIGVPPNFRAWNIKFFAIPSTSRYTLRSKQNKKSKYYNRLSHGDNHIKLGSSDKPPPRVRSDHKLVLVTPSPQGGSDQFTPYNVATFKSKYAIINSRLSDQLERSEV